MHPSLAGVVHPRDRSSLSTPSGSVTPSGAGGSLRSGVPPLLMQTWDSSASYKGVHPFGKRPLRCPIDWTSPVNDRIIHFAASSSGATPCGSAPGMSPSSLEEPSAQECSEYSASLEGCTPGRCAASPPRHPPRLPGWSSIQGGSSARGSRPRGGSRSCVSRSGCLPWLLGSASSSVAFRSSARVPALVRPGLLPFSPRLRCSAAGKGSSAGRGSVQ